MLTAMHERWTSGTTIVHFEVWNGRLWAARPMIVVDDDPELLTLWLPHGTRRKVPATPPSRPTPINPDDPDDRAPMVIANLVHEDWVLADHVWDVSTLWFIRPGDWHSLWASWSAAGTPLGWYVNLQRPFRRVAAGIEAMDLMLDVVAEPDASSWRWKDAEEFDELVDRGVFEPQLANRVRAEAASVIDRMERRSWPFDQRWHDWQPDPAWRLPALPDDWASPTSWA